MHFGQLVSVGYLHIKSVVHHTLDARTALLRLQRQWFSAPVPRLRVLFSSLV